MHYTPPPPTIPVRIKILVTWHRKGRRPPVCEAVMRPLDSDTPSVVSRLRPVGISMDELGGRLFSLDAQTLLVDAPEWIWDIEPREQDDWIASVIRWYLVERDGIPVDGRDVREAVGL